MNIVFGTGALGLAVMRELHRRNEPVRMINYHSQPVLPAEVELIHGNAKDADFCRLACKGAQVIYNCTGLPYAKWASDFIPIQRSIIEAAAASGAKLIFADNLYAYGPVHGPLHEQLPERPVGIKTSVRARLAQLVIEAHQQGRIRAAIGRAPSFYGPGVRLATLGERVIRPALVGKPAEVIGDIDQPHTHIYIDDFARALVVLADNEKALGQIWHMPADQTLTTRQIIHMIYQETGHEPKFRIANGFLLTVMGWFVPMMREFNEILYMLNQPFVVNHDKFTQSFPFEVTPHAEAVQRTVEWYRGVN